MCKGNSLVIDVGIGERLLFSPSAHDPKVLCLSVIKKGFVTDGFAIPQKDEEALLDWLLSRHDERRTGKK